MATNKDLELRVQQLEALLERAGIAVRQRSDKPEDRADYIAFGSPEHAAFLGLILLDDGQETPNGQRYVEKSRTTGRLYCLEDELGAMQFYPGLRLEDVAPIVLRQKINVFEAGAPPIPDNAPSMWTPERLMA